MTALAEGKGYAVWTAQQELANLLVKGAGAVADAVQDRWPEFWFSIPQADENGITIKITADPDGAKLLPKEPK